MGKIRKMIFRYPAACGRVVRSTDWKSFPFSVIPGQIFPHPWAHYDIGIGVKDFVTVDHLGSFVAKIPPNQRRIPGGAEMILLKRSLRDAASEMTSATIRWRDYFYLLDT
jgi:hypothetical protein